MAPSRGGGCLPWCMSPRSSVDSPSSGQQKANGVAEDSMVGLSGLHSSASSPYNHSSTAADTVRPRPLTWDTHPQGNSTTSNPLAAKHPTRSTGGSPANNRIAPLPPLPAPLPGMALVSANDNSFIGPGSVANHQNMHPARTSLTGEELHSAGFKLYNASTVALVLSTVTSQPVAFCVLDVRKSASSSDDFTDLEQLGLSRNVRNRLVPVFSNSQCRKDFNISHHSDYVSVIKKQLKRDPLLTFALQKAVRHLKAGDQRGVVHVTPDPSCKTSQLYGLRITPCVWRQEGHTFPSLMIEHNLPYDTDIVMPRLMRDYAVLSHVPAILTLIDFQGHVLYQNAASLEYMGDLLSAKYDAQLADGLLQVLYKDDLTSLEAMLLEVLQGKEWQGVVQVPYCLRKHLGHQQDADTIIDFIKVLPMNSMENLQIQSSPAHLLDYAEGGENNEDFQIGNNKTRQRGSSILFQKLGSVKQRVSGTEAPLENRTPDSFSTEPRRTSALGSGPDLASGPSAVMDMAPGIQQRKFMSLLGTPATAAGPSHKRPEETEEQIPEDEDDFGGVMSDDEGSDEEQECYHEVHAIPLLDPVLDKQVIMLVQTDVTPRVELENKLADLTDAQLSMLEQLFPRHIIEFMLARAPNKVSKNLRELANTHEQVMVLFCDVVGFTSMSKEVQASEVMHFLNELYEAFDELVDDYGMYKLDIVGDCYIVVAGLIKEDQDGFVCVDELDEDQVAQNAVRIMQFAKAMLREAQPVLMPHNKQSVSLRIGIHTGPLVSGLVGSKMPKFTLFGDTMNTASRMESTCRPGCVHVSDAFSKLLPHEDWESTGGVEVKGKGLMDTFLWVPNAQRPELVDLPRRGSGADLEGGNKITRARSLNRGTSFSSKHSRGTVRSMSRGTRRESQMTSADAMSNALLTILSNLRGGGGDSEDGHAGVSGEREGPFRPKSAKSTKIRLPGSRSKAADLRVGNQERSKSGGPLSPGAPSETGGHP